MQQIWWTMAVAMCALPVTARAHSTMQDKVPADAAPPPALTVSGSVSIASDYRFGGVSRSDREMAARGGITVTHRSGLYVGTWASNAACLRPGFSKGQDGTGNIAGSTAVVSPTAAF